jgi:two-component system, OmpR family, sensor histidine kinase KdpD
VSIVQAFDRLGALRGRRRQLSALASSVVAVVALSLLIALLEPVAPLISLGTLYLFGVLAIAIVFGIAWSVAVSVASMLTFNWFFIPPVHTFTIADSRNWFALGSYLVTAVVVSALASSTRSRAAEAEQRARETAVIADLATALLRGTDIEHELAGVAARSAEVLGASSARIELGPPHPAPAGQAPLPLTVGQRHVGTLYIDDQAAPTVAAQRRFLPALASLLAVAVDREELAREALQAETLRRSDTTKTAVLRAVSHDFRTPLTAIAAAAEGLADPSLDLTDDDRAALLDTIRVETERLTRLVANLLDLSRLQAGAADPVRELWTADGLVAQALAALGDRASRVQADLPPDLPPVSIDPAQAQRVLVNLLENALRHSPPGEPVVVRGTSTRRETIIRVVDRGPGIPADHLEEIFEPFSGDSGSGAGLGLAIARGFAEANGGRVWAESQPGQGASFALALPVQESPA